VTLDPIKVAYASMPCGSPGNMANWYAELAISSPVVADTIVSTHGTDPQRDDEAEWA